MATKKKTKKPAKEHVKAKSDTQSDAVTKIDKSLEEKSGMKLLLTALGIIIVIVAGLLAYSQFYTKNQSTTFEDIYQETLDGKESANNYMYNNFVFVKMDGAWQTRVDKVVTSGNGTMVSAQIPFFSHYGPREVESIQFNREDIRMFAQKRQISLSFDPELGQYITLSGLEFAKVFVSFYNWPQNAIVLGLISENSSEKFPQITCANATDSNAVVVFTLSNTTEITRKENCMTVSGTTPEEVLRSSDRLMFGLLGIIK